MDGRNFKENFKENYISAYEVAETQVHQQEVSKFNTIKDQTLQQKEFPNKGKTKV